MSDVALFKEIRLIRNASNTKGMGTNDCGALADYLERKKVFSSVAVAA